MSIYDEIAKVAHELFIKRGHAHGHDVEDWLAAERIVRARHAEKAPERGEAQKTKKRPAVKVGEEKTAKPVRKSSATRTKSTSVKKKAE